ncbi:hypothetical protein HAX54_039234 [Datura stramonium]|uniref:Uncharacterized protein n=1 Tax=Datura stramonium TaxID=4076 RepID=A0ABS8SJU5_DATST|nr:hypothetical protein [Datura stramonium]
MRTELGHATVLATSGVPAVVVEGPAIAEDLDLMISVEVVGAVMASTCSIEALYLCFRSITSKVPTELVLNLFATQLAPHPGLQATTDHGKPKMSLDRESRFRRNFSEDPAIMDCRSSAVFLCLNSSFLLAEPAESLKDFGNFQTYSAVNLWTAFLVCDCRIFLFHSTSTVNFCGLGCLSAGRRVVPRT